MAVDQQPPAESQKWMDVYGAKTGHFVEDGQHLSQPAGSSVNHGGQNEVKIEADSSSKAQGYTVQNERGAAEAQSNTKPKPKIGLASSRWASKKAEPGQQKSEKQKQKMPVVKKLEPLAESSVSMTMVVTKRELSPPASSEISSTLPIWFKMPDPATSKAPVMPQGPIEAPDPDPASSTPQLLIDVSTPVAAQTPVKAQNLVTAPAAITAPQPTPDIPHHDPSGKDPVFQWLDSEWDARMAKQRRREIGIKTNFRQVMERDLPQIAEIYNHEAKTSYNVPDQKPLDIEAFHRLLDSCRAHKLPFIIAKKEHSDKVYGFALMQVADRGLMGSHSTRAALCGKLLVLVHNRYRHRNLGSALLDAMLTFCSVNYTKQVGWSFYNIGNNPIYKFAKDSARAWFYADLEVVLPSTPLGPGTRVEDTEEYQSLIKHLEPFNMQLVHHEVSLYRDDRFGRGNWLDKLTFRHQCRDVEYSNNPCKIVSKKPSSKPW
ncbi:uncharacterized protein F4822DRAFT_439646 [Hypoxylon trugodes]|uniref:uncharacterized protein n=1 Tax=Hypoxylon trugodes TaxID=326681 RepID=UPI0021A14747|nr:uncharacterized protein F4822DRAFT_439646 [Hypoxylon trugodes]KAI1393690.1 hypothetical protein F4822DRAFT_439646 [Hypoxylon trugodes]